MMLYLRFAWRELCQRPSRPILTLLSVVIGVAAVVAVTIASGTASRAFDQIFKTVAGKAALEISTGTGNSFDEKVVAKIREVPGVVAVAPTMARDTQIQIGQYGHNPKKYRLSALGVDPATDRDVRDYEITAGKPLPTSLDEDSGVLLEANFAKKQNIKLGEKVQFLSQEGPIRAPIIGLYSSNHVAAGGTGAPMYMPLIATQEYWHNRGRIDSAQIVTAPDADQEKIENAIAALLPKGVTVQPPATRSAMAEELSLSTDQGMRMARGFSLLVAVIIIANTFLINVAQRRRQIGIMRAIGATRSQIGGMMYREALFMGVVGTILGSLLGIVAAHYLSIAMGTLYQSELPPIELTVTPFVIAALCGLGISLIAAILPARKASHLSPLEAMRDVLPGEIEGTQWWLTGLGAAIVVVSLSVMTVSVLAKLSMVHTVWSAILLLVGLVLLLPVALGPLSKFTTLVMKPFVPVEGRLARLQLLRHRSRTTLTVAVVFIAAATGIALANSVMDNVNDVRGWASKTIVADFFVRAAEPSMATGLAPDLPDGVGDAIKNVDGTSSIEAVRLGRIKLPSGVANLVARDHTSEGPPELDVISGDVESLREQFKNGGVALGTVLAQRAKLKVGDTITLETETGEKKFPVAAIIEDYQGGGLTIHIERAVARNDLGYDGVSGYVIKADKDKLADVRRKLEAISNDYGLLLETSEDIRARIDRMMSGVVASLWAMVVLLLLVSAVGVTNTLTINVLEQTREVGLLRIVAMTQAQVRKTVFTQAVIIGLLALVPGIVAGVSVAYLINLATMSVIGHPVVFKFHPLLLGGGLLAGFAVVAFAAMFPANRAAKLDLLDALRTL
jgi:putative ABC transport system permease protein